MQQLGGPLRQGFFALGSLHTSSLQALRACSSYATSCSQLDQPSIQSWFENVQGSSATKTEANSLPSSSCQSRVNTCSFASGVLYFRPRACSAMGPPRCSLGPPRAITDTLAPYQSLTGLYESRESNVFYHMFWTAFTTLSSQIVQSNQPVWWRLHNADRLYSSLPEQPASSSAPSEPGGSPQKHPRDSKERTADQGSSAPASEPGSSAKVGSFEGNLLPACASSSLPVYVLVSTSMHISHASAVT